MSGKSDKLDAASEKALDWATEILDIKAIRRWPVRRTEVIDSHEAALIGRKYARGALAEIANAQMNTWTPYPTADTPEDIIARQIILAIESAQKKEDV